MLFAAAECHQRLRKHGLHCVACRRFSVFLCSAKESRKYYIGSKPCCGACKPVMWNELWCVFVSARLRLNFLVIILPTLFYFHMLCGMMIHPETQKNSSGEFQID